jgi:hypothetical protein
MTDRLKNKVAVITGSGGGVGKAIAFLMASEGANIVVNDLGRDADGEYLADKVVQEITKAKGRAAANYDSVATMAGGVNIINTAIKNFGRIDILVNNCRSDRGSMGCNHERASERPFCLRAACYQRNDEAKTRQNYQCILDGRCTGDWSGLLFCKSRDPRFYDQSCY